MKNFFEKYGVGIIFLIFFLIVLIQHQFMYIYHDDYGYASLSYAYNVENVEGHDVNLEQIVEFLKGHYEVWGGRILTFFYEIILLTNGPWLYRLLQSIVITLIFFLIYKIVKKCVQNKIDDRLLALCTVMCYGVFEIMLVRTGIFWASAAVSYLFPILPLLAFIYLYEQSKEKDFKNLFTKIIFYLFCGILIFTATFSQEQISVAALGYILILTIYNIVKNKRVDKLDLIMCLVAILGFSILMLAPGNILRQQHPTSIEFYSKPIVERLELGIQNLIFGNFSNYTKIFNMIFYISIAYASYVVVKRKKGIKILSCLSLLSILFIIFVNMTQQTEYFEWVYGLLTNNIYKKLVIVGFMFQFLLMFYSVIVYLYDEKKLKLINIVTIAIFSVGCMIIAPYFAPRSSIAFEILCLVFILYMFVQFYDSVTDKKMINFILVPTFVIFLCNVLIITNGYYKNSSINRENDKILTQVSERIDKGEDIRQVTLKKLNNILYSGDQPYMEGNDYITIYMKEYYNLPKDLDIIYE